MYSTRSYKFYKIASKNKNYWIDECYNVKDDEDTKDKEKIDSPMLLKTEYYENTCDGKILFIYIKKLENECNDE